MHTRTLVPSLCRHHFAEEAITPDLPKMSVSLLFSPDNVPIELIFSYIIDTVY